MVFEEQENRTSTLNHAPYGFSYNYLIQFHNMTYGAYILRLGESQFELEVDIEIIKTLERLMNSRR